jgi:hypothetical protein
MRGVRASLLSPRRAPRLAPARVVGPRRAVLPARPGGGCRGGRRGWVGCRRRAAGVGGRARGRGGAGRRCRCRGACRQARRRRCGWRERKCRGLAGRMRFRARRHGGPWRGGGARGRGGRVAGRGRVRDVEHDARADAEVPQLRALCQAQFDGAARTCDGGDVARRAAEPRQVRHAGRGEGDARGRAVDRDAVVDALGPVEDDAAMAGVVSAANRDARRLGRRLGRGLARTEQQQHAERGPAHQDSPASRRSISSCEAAAGGSCGPWARR